MKTLLIGLLVLGSISAFGYDCDKSVKELKKFIEMKQKALDSKVFTTVVQNDQWIQRHKERLSMRYERDFEKIYCFHESVLPKFNEQMLKFKTDREEIVRRLEENKDELDRIIYDLTIHCTGKIPDEEM